MTPAERAALDADVSDARQSVNIAEARYDGYLAMGLDLTEVREHKRKAWIVFEHALAARATAPLVEALKDVQRGLVPHLMSIARSECTSVGDALHKVNGVISSIQSVSRLVDDALAAHRNAEG